MRLRRPDLHEGPQLHELVRQCPPLDLNSIYLYLLLAHHFRDTCIVAESDGRLMGMISAYQPPADPDALFIWQVAVHPQARRQGLGQRMLHTLLSRRQFRGLRWVRSTVGPGNRASRKLFARLATDLGTQLQEQPLFEADLFGAGQHEAEPLISIGPIPRLQPSAQAIHPQPTGE